MRLSYFQFLPLSDFLHLKSANIKIVSSIFSFINSDLLNQAEYTIFSNGRIPSGGVKFTVSQRLPLLFESCTVHHKKIPRLKGLAASFLVDIPSRWEPPWPYGLHLLIFPQPLGRALKNQNAAPTTPPCFCRRQRSSSLLFESCTVHHKKIPRPNGLGMWWTVQDSNL